jgi:hypothetical protein
MKRRTGLESTSVWIRVCVGPPPVASSSADIRGRVAPPLAGMVMLPHRCTARDGDDDAGANARVHVVEVKRPTSRRRGDVRFILLANYDPPSLSTTLSCLRAAYVLVFVRGPDER